MIERYSRPEMTRIWSDENKFQNMLKVEVALAKAQADFDIIPKKAAQEIAKKGKFKVARIQELEKTTKHDVIAFVSNVAENVGEMGRYVHFGMTSSDILDTAQSLLIQQAWGVLSETLKSLEKALKRLAQTHVETLCAGRTHGMHAEPTSFGLKMAGHLVELRRNQKKLDQAVREASIAKLSGAVGTYSTSSPEIESKVADLLALEPESIATQVVPRDRHAQVMMQLGLLGSSFERLAVELRHLQRTEVSEVVEGFSKGQKGSSAMPHKRNPIGSENITGCARLLRSYAAAALENVALWHERDISHSSVERVIFPDAFILADYAAQRMADLVDNLEIDKKRMLANMELSGGMLFSSHILLLLVEKGLSREDAYKVVQSASHSLKAGEHLKEKLLKDKDVRSRVSKKELDQIFSGKQHLGAIRKAFRRAMEEKS